MSILRTLPSKSLLATSLSLITLTATAASAGNGPVSVSPEPLTFEQLKNLRQDLRLQESNERYIVTFKNGKGAMAGKGSINASDKALDVASVKSAIQQAGGKTLKVMERHGMAVVTLNKKALNALRKSKDVDIAPDPVRELMAQSTPYGYTMVQANQLIQSDTSARKVCIIDTGYNLGHPDLPGTNDGVTGIGNNSAVGNWYNDGNGHGTHVAGTIAAYDNSEGVIGVYPGASLHIVKIFNDNGDWTYASDIITAIDQCQDAGADVVNMSLGGSGSSSAEASAMQGFTDDNMLLVAAAGNAGNSSLSYPASYDAVVSVAAVDSGKNRASYSQYNSQVEIAGPGSSVYSTYPDSTYATLSGTSMATPHVVGAAALVWSFHPQCSATQIRNALNATAEDRGSSGRDNQYGYGIVRVAEANSYLNNNGCDGSGNGGGDPTDPGVEPVSGQLTGLSGSRSSWDRYTWDIPAGVSTMTIQISGGSGDADLYVRYGSQPSTSAYDCRPYKNGNSEVCTFTAPADGTWHIGLRAYSTYSNVTLSYSYE
ncbi:S8 family serine peptidase [Alteromonas sp. RKMC-009]|uniref:S8 family serine peptidase n=1 Tax=Alteromonas sp. RKMC-009 TaxID=2267264 RepID=UPI000E691CD0|nr:S8 family serine peptidase [Alteromonas sp. RKMC-009]AYA65718.1 peptidase S8 [Alteromonas sp. RKMC-009]